MYLKYKLNSQKLPKFDKISKIIKKNFGLRADWDKNSLNFRMSKYDPSRELSVSWFYINNKDHKPHIYSGESDQHSYRIKKLNNGITVITETTAFPSNINMGIIIDVGTRDETHESSGALLAIKNTYLKTLKHTNETLNYGMIQMSGGETNMEYDEETMWYSSSCLEYDTLDMFRMLADIAFEPKSFLAANVIT